MALKGLEETLHLYLVLCLWIYSMNALEVSHSQRLFFPPKKNLNDVNKGLGQTYIRLWRVGVRARATTVLVLVSSIVRTICSCNQKYVSYLIGMRR